MKYQKALEFTRTVYKKNVDIIGNSFMHELTGVADVLEEFNYGLDYKLTAVFRNLLRDTDVRPDEILNHSNMDILEAVQLLTKTLQCDMYKYYAKILSNMLAHPVKLAEQLYYLRNASSKSPEYIDDLLQKSEKHLLQCAENSVFYEDIFKEIINLKN